MIADAKTRTNYAAMMALAATKYYAAIIPDDATPYRAVAAILSEQPDDALIQRYRGELEAIEHRFVNLVAEFSVRSGSLVSALEGLRAIIAALARADVNDVRTHLELAKHAVGSRVTIE